MRLRGKTDDCPIGLTEAMELWLGPSPDGSAFSSREELLRAWERGRAYVMRLWARGARRPQAWWHLGDAASLGLTWPGQDRERSYLYAAGVLTVEERTEVVREWRREFDVACGMGARERREHLAYHDVPAELVTAWEAERKPRRRRARQSDSPTASGSQSMNLNVPTTPSEEAAAIK